jgi:hypothetical protein
MVRGISNCGRKITGAMLPENGEKWIQRWLKEIGKWTLLESAKKKGKVLPTA